MIQSFTNFFKIVLWRFTDGTKYRLSFEFYVLGLKIQGIVILLGVTDAVSKFINHSRSTITDFIFLTN